MILPLCAPIVSFSSHNSELDDTNLFNLRLLELDLRDFSANQRYQIFKL